LSHGLKLPIYRIIRKTHLKYINRNNNKICPKLEDTGLDLIDKMLKCNPNERVTAKNAISHEYFADIVEQFESLYKK